MMKKVLAVLFVLLLGLSLLAACGNEKNTDGTNTSGTPAKGERLKYEYFSFEEGAGGWMFWENSGGIELQNKGIEDAVITINAITNGDKTPAQRMEDYLAKNENNVQADTVTYSNIEYLAAINAAQQTTYLLTVQAAPLAGDSLAKECILEITIEKASLNQAAAILETLQINSEPYDYAAAYTWPESEDVELEYLTYTAKDGWYLYNKFDKPNNWRTSGELCNDDLDYTAVYMEFSVSDIQTVNEEIERIKFAYTDATQGENVTIAGITYVQMEDEYAIWLLTTDAPAFDPDTGGSITIRIDAESGIEGAKSVLETIKIK